MRYPDEDHAASERTGALVVVTPVVGSVTPKVNSAVPSAPSVVHVMVIAPCGASDGVTVIAPVPVCVTEPTPPCVVGVVGMKAIVEPGAALSAYCTASSPSPP